MDLVGSYPDALMTINFQV